MPKRVQLKRRPLRALLTDAELKAMRMAALDRNESMEGWLGFAVREKLAREPYSRPAR